MTPVRLEDTGLEILAPEGVTVQEHPGVDWLEYRFFAGPEAEQNLFVYLGDHPRFPLYPPAGGVIEQFQAAGCTAFSIRWSGAEGGLHREVLVDRGPNSGRDRLLHLIYSGLSPEEAELADTLIGSLRAA